MLMQIIRVTLLLLLFPVFALADTIQFSDPHDMPNHFLIGYGSLVNEKSRIRSLKQDVIAIPVRIAADFGYRRTWNTRITGMMTTLGLIKADTSHGQSINGVLYAVKDNDMAVWDKREGSYNRVEVPWKYIRSLCWVQLPKEGKVWIYVTKPEFSGSSTVEEPVTQSYVDLVISGFMEFSDDFAKEFIKTTDDWPKYWLNDRLMSRRPWEHNSQALQIDQLLRETLPESVRAMTIDRRRYSSDYFLYAEPKAKEASEF